METKQRVMHIEKQRHEIVPEVARLADQWAKALGRELGLRQDVTVRWFAPLEPGVDARGRKTLALDGPHAGYFAHDEPYTIWVSTKQRPMGTARTIAHELKHAADFELWGPYEEHDNWWWECEARERRAEKFAEEMVGRWAGH